MQYLFLSELSFPELFASPRVGIIIRGSLRIRASLFSDSQKPLFRVGTSSLGRREANRDRVAYSHASMVLTLLGRSQRMYVCRKYPETRRARSLPSHCILPLLSQPYTVDQGKCESYCCVFSCCDTH